MLCHHELNKLSCSVAGDETKEVIPAVQIVGLGHVSGDRSQWLCKGPQVLTVLTNAAGGT